MFMRENEPHGLPIDVRQAFDEHHALLLRFAYRLTGSVADAEDIVQVCFLELLRPGHLYDPSRGPVRAWLLGIVRNQFLKRCRQKPAPDVAWASLAPSPEQEILRSEIENVVRRAVLMLPENQRDVLILAHYEQMPLAQIATILRIEVGAVKSRLQRARASLKEALAAHAPKLERKP
jgi:RNA polymerase sigma-70 factor, ECF subfamily